MKAQLFKFFTGFIILFVIYHSAEYMIMFKNNAAGFLGFQALFFAAAYLIAKWQFKQGFAAWGLDTGKGWLKNLIAGMVMGIVLYTLTFLISLWYGSETLLSVPGISESLYPFLLFSFGCIFSSLSEDIFTRAYLFRHLEAKTGKLMIVLISAFVYLLNHIYRLSDGVVAWTYLFALGILFIIPLVLTRRLWFTGAMHWAGNSLFYLTHEIFQTQPNPEHLSPNYILTICILIMLPINYWVLKMFRLIPDGKTAGNTSD